MKKRKRRGKRKKGRKERRKQKEGGRKKERERKEGKEGKGKERTPERNKLKFFPKYNKFRKSIKLTKITTVHNAVYKWVKSDEF